MEMEDSDVDDDFFFQAVFSSTDDDNDLVQAVKQETEPDAHVLYRLVQNYSNDIDVLCEALYSAVYSRFLNSARILLEAGASPNTLGLLHYTPLHLCSDDEQGIEMVRLLLKHGANVNAEDWEERTPLHEASEHQCLEIMQELLNNGARVDAVDGEGKTPLLLAMERGPRVSTVQVLLRAGADVNHRDNYRDFPLYHAVEIASLELVQLLFHHKADANVRYDGETLLHRIVRNEGDSSEMITEFCKGGAMLNVLDSGGRSALYWAINNRNVGATQLLLRYGAPFDVVECLYVLNVFTNQPRLEIGTIAQHLIRYTFIKNSDSLESIRQQLMQDKVIRILRKASSLECNLENFKHACLSEVEALSKRSCDCGKSSVWGSIMAHPACRCDTHQAILKFLFSERPSNFTDALFYKMSKEFLVEVNLNLISYFEFKESEKRFHLPWPCMKETERHVSFEEAVLFLQSKHSKMSASEFEKFQAFIESESPGKSSSEISPPIPKRLRVS